MGAEELERLYKVATEAEDPVDSLGPAPWSVEVAAVFEERHGHDVRLHCFKVDFCKVIDEAEEKLIAEIPLLVEVAKAARKNPWVRSHKGIFEYDVCYWCGGVKEKDFDWLVSRRVFSMEKVGEGFKHGKRPCLLNKLERVGGEPLG